MGRSRRRRRRRRRIQPDEEPKMNRELFDKAQDRVKNSPDKVLNRVKTSPEAKVTP